MNWVNYSDAANQLRDAGFDVTDPEVGRMRRCKVEGMTQKGWYALHEITLDDGRGAVVGAYGWWVGAEKFVFNIKLNLGEGGGAFSTEQQAALKKRLADDRKRAEAQRKAGAERAASEAARAWRQYSNDGQSEYLTRKGIHGHGVRYTGRGAIVIPLMNVQNQVRGLQLIRDKDHPKVKQLGRDKDFWPSGLQKAGHFFLIGMPGPVCLIAEGYATAATLHEATGLPVAVAFDAGNLGPVASALAKAYRSTRWLICADDDFLTEGNPGVAKATAAALQIGGAWVAPKFAEDRGTVKLTDFNDLHLKEGMHIVRQQIEDRITALGWKTTAPMAAKRSAPGGGETGKGRRQAVAVLDLDEIVQRFVPLDDGTGDYVFDTWTNKVAKKSQMLALLPAGVRGDDIKRHIDWITRGAFYLDQVGFDPSGKDRGVKLNTWQGWPMEPKAGECDLLLQLIQYLCKDDPNGTEVAEWLLDWMAYPLQNPGAKMASAVIMHGPQGTGKSTVFQTLAKIYGDYSTVLNQRGLEDKFNSDWSDSKLFILAEEVVTRAEMWHIKNELKELVTGEWIRINPKNIAAYRQRNQVNIVYLSNENQPLPLDNDDRRHLVVYTPPALAESYYDEVFIELENGGVAAFYEFLLRRDLSKFHPKKRPPMTDAKQRLIALSAASEIRFIIEWIMGDLGLPISPCLSSDCYAAYLKWCRANGESRPRPSNQFFGSIAHAQGWEKKKARIYIAEHDTETTAKPLIYPPVQVMERAGTAIKPGELPTKWLSRCVRDFSNAIQSAEGGARWAA